MEKPLFERIKSALAHGAVSSVHKVEETARLGKLKLDLRGEERRKQKHYTALGQLVHTAIGEEALEATMQGREVAIELGRINEVVREIAQIQAKIAEIEKETSSESDFSQSDASQK